MPKDRKKTYSDHQSQAARQQKLQAKKITARREPKTVESDPNLGPDTGKQLLEAAQAGLKEKP